MKYWEKNYGYIEKLMGKLSKLFDGLTDNTRENFYSLLMSKKVPDVLSDINKAHYAFREISALIIRQTIK